MSEASALVYIVLHVSVYSAAVFLAFLPGERALAVARGNQFEMSKQDKLESPRRMKKGIDLVSEKLSLPCYCTMHLRQDGCVTTLDLTAAGAAAIFVVVVAFIVVGQQTRMITSAAPDRPAGAA